MIVRITLLTLAASVGAACSNGSKDGDGEPPILAKDELQGKIFKKGETAYYSFEDGEVSFIDCSMNGRAYFDLAGKTRNIEMSPEEAAFDFVVLATKDASGLNVTYRAIFAPKAVTGFRADNTLTDKEDQIVYVSDKDAGSLSWEEIKTIPSATITGFIYLKDDTRVDDRSRLDDLLSSGNIEDNVKVCLFIRPVLHTEKRADYCIQLLKMPYVIQEGAVNIEWRNAKTPEGTDPYGTGDSSPSTIFGFDDRDESWTPVVKGESYMWRDAMNGEPVEARVGRVNKLPTDRDTFKNR